jgi:Mg/Co/Ni transporter MgtE
MEPKEETKQKILKWIKNDKGWLFLILCAYIIFSIVYISFYNKSGVVLTLQILGMSIAGYCGF